MHIKEYLDYLPRLAKSLLVLWFLILICIMYLLYCLYSTNIDINSSLAILLSSLLASLSVIITLLASLNMNYQNESLKNRSQYISTIQKSNNQIFELLKNISLESEITSIEHILDFKINLLKLDIKKITYDKSVEKELITSLLILLTPTIKKLSDMEIKSNGEYNPEKAEVINQIINKTYSDKYTEEASIIKKLLT